MTARRWDSFPFGLPAAPLLPGQLLRPAREEENPRDQEHGSHADEAERPRGRCKGAVDKEEKPHWDDHPDRVVPCSATVTTTLPC